jgi:hypothetical protein
MVFMDGLQGFVEELGEQARVVSGLALPLPELAAAAPQALAKEAPKKDARL